MKVLLVDYGMGNLRSVERAFVSCGAATCISEDPQDAFTASHIVLPGVGAFPEAMKGLQNTGWAQAIRESTGNRGIPLLGICLGMQLLASEGQEGERCPGLGLIPGKVVRLVPMASDERIPHMGWNEVRHDGSCPILSGVSSGVDFYFVHGYHLVPDNTSHAAGRTPFCGEFVSVVQHDHIFGVQFHPEKSHRPGFRVIRNFLEQEIR